MAFLPDGLQLDLLHFGSTPRPTFESHMNLKYAAAALLCFAPLIANAQPGACSSIADSASRLACYDRAHPPALVGAAAELGNWRVSKTVDAMTDEATHYATLFANPFLVGGQPLPSTTTLHIRCTGGATELYLVRKEKFMFGPSTLTHRVDKAPAINAQWLPNDSGTAAFLDSNVPQLIHQLANSSVFAVRIGQGDLASTLTFNTKGAEAALAPMLDGCKG